MRTQDEIVAYVKAGDGFINWAVDVCCPYLDYEHGKPWLNPEVAPGDWVQKPYDEAVLLKEAAEYAVFAWGKAQDQRGLSASRSVDKLRAFAFMLGRDDVVAAMDAAEYAQYGAPKLEAFCEGMGFPVPTDADLVAMMHGELP